VYEADKAGCDFAAYIASAYRLSTRKTTILDWKDKIPGLDLLLKHKRNLRNLWQEIRDPVVVSCCRYKLVAEARDSSGTQQKGTVCHWKPLPSNGSEDVTVDTGVCVLVKCEA
jgi:hypothetical protein